MTVEVVVVVEFVVDSTQHSITFEPDGPRRSPWDQNPTTDNGQSSGVVSCFFRQRLDEVTTVNLTRIQHASTNCHGNDVDLTSMTIPTANQKDISISIDNWHAPAQLPVAIQHPCKPPDPPSISTPIGTASSKCIELVANNHAHTSMLAVNVPVLIGLTLAIDPHLCMHWWEMVHFIDPDNPLFTVHRNQNLHYNCTGWENGETSEISLPHPKDPSTWICQNAETYMYGSAYASDIAFVIKYIQTSLSRNILL